jgi:acyl-CoA reductase-like NAD-dependent aldehyde dehydrogenase
VIEARRAFESWREGPAPKRARVMFAYRDLLERSRGELQRIINSEYGRVASVAAASRLDPASRRAIEARGSAIRRGSGGEALGDRERVRGIYRDLLRDGTVDARRQRPW